jgi:hypothetical protein
MPTIGPTTTPAIQALFFAGVLDSEDCGVLVLDDETLDEVAAMLAECETAEVVPGSASAQANWTTGWELYWMLSIGHLS